MLTSYTWLAAAILDSTNQDNKLLGEGSRNEEKKALQAVGLGLYCQGNVENSFGAYTETPFKFLKEYQ